SRRCARYQFAYRNIWSRAKLITDRAVCGNRHSLCVNRRVDKGETYKRPRKSDIEFLWIQLEDIIEHNINKGKNEARIATKALSVTHQTGRKNKQERKRVVRT